MRRPFFELQMMVGVTGLEPALPLAKNRGRCVARAGSLLPLRVFLLVLPEKRHPVAFFGQNPLVPKRSGRARSLSTSGFSVLLGLVFGQNQEVNLLSCPPIPCGAFPVWVKLWVRYLRCKSKQF